MLHWLFPQHRVLLMTKGSHRLRRLIVQRSFRNSRSKLDLRNPADELPRLVTIAGRLVIAVIKRTLRRCRMSEQLAAAGRPKWPGEDRSAKQAPR